MGKCSERCRKAQGQWNARFQDWTERATEAYLTAPVVTEYYTVRDGFFGPYEKEVDYPAQVSPGDTVYRRREPQVDPAITAEGFAIALSKPDRNAEIAGAFVARVAEAYHIPQKAAVARRVVFPTVLEKLQRKQSGLMGK